jgi:hypothetical protein
MQGGERDTLPPPAEELALVVEFERAARVNENDARLAHLARLVHGAELAEALRDAAE